MRNGVARSRRGRGGPRSGELEGGVHHPKDASLACKDPFHHDPRTEREAGNGPPAHPTDRDFPGPVEENDLEGLEPLHGAKRDAADDAGELDSRPRSGLGDRDGAGRRLGPVPYLFGETLLVGLGETTEEATEERQGLGDLIRGFGRDPGDLPRLGHGSLAPEDLGLP